jgi:PhzF family phenazine biosynthesis protein
MKTRPFKQVDVFTATPYFGNPLAVVLDGTELSDDAMQRFAQWTNLSETTFVLPPSSAAKAAGADYRVRIFTPGGELPFAGHPTLGTCHAWLQAGGQQQAGDYVTQESQIGLVKIRRDGNRLAFGAPPLTRSAPGPTLLAQVAAALGLKAQQIASAQVLDNGPVWLGLLLDSQNTVLQIQPNHAEIKKLGQKIGVVSLENTQSSPPLISRSNREAKAFATSEKLAHDDDAPTVEVRAFAASVGIDEDPVTGSLNASLAQWLIADGYAPSRYVAAQGTCMGRAGRVYIEQDANSQVWVGGQSVTCVEGSVTL